MARKKEEYPYFRYYKKANHPALITGEHSNSEYKYRKVMHSEKDGKRNNEKSILIRIQMILGLCILLKGCATIKRRTLATGSILGNILKNSMKKVVTTRSIIF